MTYQEQERARIKRQTSKQAVDLAVQGKWQDAIKVNRDIIAMFADDVEAYNRLGRAHMELGQYQDAETAYKKAIELDKYNSIAQKNLQRLNVLKQSKVNATQDAGKLDPQDFIEETGKAGVIQLIRLAPPPVLARSVAGDRLSLKRNGSVINVENMANEYLGQVDPRHAKRLTKLMEGGNQYSGAIVTSAPNEVIIIIREVYQHPSQTGILSFPSHVEALPTMFNDRALRRELEQEEEYDGEAGYTVIGGEEPEYLAEEKNDADEEDENEE